MKRNIKYYRTNYLLHMLTACLLSITFSDVSLEDSNSVQNIQGVMSILISEQIFLHMFLVLYVFQEEMNIFLKDKNLYGILPYFLSKLVSLIPVCLVNSGSFLLIYFVILKFLFGFTLYLSIWYILFLTSLIGIAFGLCLSALFTSLEYVILFIAPAEVLVTLLSGIWIKIDTVPAVFGIIKFFSPFYFGFQTVSTLIWRRVDHLGNCTQEVLPPCYNDGKEVLQHFGFLENYDVVTYNIVYLHVLLVLFCTLGYIGMIRKRALYNCY